MTDASEITTLSTTVIYESNWIRVEKSDVRFADGSPGTFDRITRKNFVAVIALDDAGCIHLVEQYRFGAAVRMIELPMGGVEEGEDPAVAALRELREETGAQAASLLHLGRLPTNAAYMRQHFDIYLATGLTHGETSLDAGEQGLTPVKLSVTEMEAMIRDGRITNEHTLAAFCLARLKGLL